MEIPSLLSALMPALTFAELFPNGVSHYAIGGVFIGLGVAVIYLGSGIIAGASTFLETTLSYVSDVPRFQKAKYLASRDWRVVFTLGVVGGAVIYQAAFHGEIWTTDVVWWRLLGGGVLVGIGTRIGKGCTSGHGVCGVGSASSTSIVNVATFMTIAIGTAQLMQAVGMGVSP
ncbi:YeeE/YedE family protein [Haladaptatus pallidirubidus]|uniref:YeeE/YedE family protein n=1 Tax=Haladaptatus pallidirubidus TaxID=1008152 RepID=A0AAV3UKC9_9EURY|nr:YeeE/YedE thiosulfate transporter family protein [Haladaptatus pallidirubidus]